MTQGRRWLVVTPGLIAAMALGFGAAAAADKGKVDQATQQVQQGARQIGQGNVGPGVKETAKGIGNTIVEGAKFSGQTIKEFFAGK
jgi:ABC-type microcin C transport system permease subunit YejB